MTKPTERPARSAAGRRSEEVLALPPGPELPLATQEWIVDGLVDSMPGLRTRELFTHRRDMLTTADYVIAAVDRRRDTVAGLLTSRRTELPSGLSCLHVMIQFIGDEYRHGPLFGQSWTEHFTRLLADGHPFPEVIALKTYNPVVHCAMSAFSGHPEITMYPDLGKENGSRASLAAEVASALSPAAPFDPVRGVLRGIGVPVDLYREEPLCSLPAANEFFAASARPGDRVLCILHAPTPSGQHAILSALGVPLPAHSSSP